MYKLHAGGPPIRQSKHQTVADALLRSDDMTIAQKHRQQLADFRNEIPRLERDLHYTEGGGAGGHRRLGGDRGELHQVSSWAGAHS